MDKRPFGVCLMWIIRGVLAIQVGDQLEKVGNDPVPAKSGLLYANRTFLIEDIILQDGILFGYSAHFLSNDPIRFQIWRPHDVFRREFTLISETRIVPNDWGRQINIYIRQQPNGRCIPVHTGDRLGVLPETQPASIGYHFQSKNPVALTYNAQTKGRAKIGETKTFDPLTFPYDYSVAAYIHTEMTKYIGNAIPECPYGIKIPTETESVTNSPAVSITGGHGATGATGPRGPQGDPGPRGEPGVAPPRDFLMPRITNQNKVITQSTTWGGLEVNTLFLILLLWIGLITVMNAVFMVWAVWVFKQSHTKSRQRRRSRSEDGKRASSYIVSGKVPGLDLGDL